MSRKFLLAGIVYYLVYSLVPHGLIAQSTDNGLFEGVIRTYMVDGRDLLIFHKE
jgi:hypothetical protein